MVHIFVPQRGPRKLCVRLAARCGLADQVYQKGRVATEKGIEDGCRRAATLIEEEEEKGEEEEDLVTDWRFRW